MWALFDDIRIYQSLYCRHCRVNIIYRCTHVKYDVWCSISWIEMVIIVRERKRVWMVYMLNVRSWLPQDKLTFPMGISLRGGRNGFTTFLVCVRVPCVPLVPWIKLLLKVVYFKRGSTVKCNWWQEYVCLCVFLCCGWEPSHLYKFHPHVWKELYKVPSHGLLDVAKSSSFIIDW